eukprot:2522100-Prymnesium_polylepis.1
MAAERRAGRLRGQGRAVETCADAVGRPTGGEGHAQSAAARRLSTTLRSVFSFLGKERRLTPRGEMRYPNRS